MIAEELKVIITAQNQQFDKAMKSTTSTMGKAQKAMGALTKLAGSVGLAFGAAAAIRAIKSFSDASVMAASDLEEVNNKFRVTFRDVADSAAGAADELVRTYRMSRRESMDLLSATGDLLTGFGFAADKSLELSDAVVKLGADLASFQNIEGGAPEASKALTKALLGETESAKSLGIVIRQADVDARLAADGKDKLTGQTLLQAQAEARLQIALEQSKNAIGDLERSSESYANQSRALESATEDLKAAFGATLLPTLARAKGAYSEMLRGITDNISAANDLRSIQAGVDDPGVDTARERLDLYYAQLAVQGENKRLTDEQIKQGEEQNKKRLESVNAEKIERQAQLAHYAITGEATDEQTRMLELKKTALERIEELRVGSLSPQQKQLEQTQQEINKWAEILKNVEKGTEAYTALNNVIIQLADKRSGLREALKDSVDSSEELKKIEVDLTENQFEQLNRRVNDFKLNQENLLEIRRQRADEEARIAQETADKEKAIMDEVEKTSMQAFNAIGSIASNMYDERIKNAQEGSDEEKKLMREKAVTEKTFALFSIMINTAKGIVQAIPNIPLMILAGVQGGIQAAVVASQPIPSFAEGGSFVADRPQLIQVGDNPAQRERVTVEPMNGGQGGMMHVTVKLGEETLYDNLTRASKNGQFIIDSRSIRN